MMLEPLRGEIWWVDWSPGRGSEQSGRRPALIVQNDPANRNPRYPNTIVIAISTKGRLVSFHFLLKPTSTNGLGEPCYAKCEQIMTIDKERLVNRIGRITQDEMAQVDEALKIVLALK